MPFLHFFDGFRTSHEIQKIASLDDATLEALLDDDAIAAHRERGAVTRTVRSCAGTAQNPDTFFQAREAANPFHDACPAIVADDHGPLRRAHRAPLPPLRLRRPPRGRAGRRR
ncbi:MAG: hypothetical protein U5R31_00650 [Acidimicrobiia bacterium]|nr:hypothetical protein [Acidimicrobiia bacterium]